MQVSHYLPQARTFTLVERWISLIYMAFAEKTESVTDAKRAFRAVSLCFAARMVYFSIIMTPSHRKSITLETKIARRVYPLTDASIPPKKRQWQSSAESCTLSPRIPNATSFAGDCKIDNILYCMHTWQITMTKLWKTIKSPLAILPSEPLTAARSDAFVKL